MLKDSKLIKEIYTNKEVVSGFFSLKRFKNNKDEYEYNDFISSGKKLSQIITSILCLVYNLTNTYYFYTNNKLSTSINNESKRICFIVMFSFFIISLFLSLLLPVLIYKTSTNSKVNSMFCILFITTNLIRYYLYLFTLIYWFDNNDNNKLASVVRNFYLQTILFVIQYAFFLKPIPAVAILYITSYLIIFLICSLKLSLNTIPEVFSSITGYVIFYGVCMFDKNKRDLFFYSKQADTLATYLEGMLDNMQIKFVSFINDSYVFCNKSLYADIKNNNKFFNNDTNISLNNYDNKSNSLINNKKIVNNKRSTTSKELFLQNKNLNKFNNVKINNKVFKYSICSEAKQLKDTITTNNIKTMLEIENKSTNNKTNITDNTVKNYLDTFIIDKSNIEIKNEFIKNDISFNNNTINNESISLLSIFYKLSNNQQNSKINKFDKNNKISCDLLNKKLSFKSLGIFTRHNCKNYYIVYYRKFFLNNDNNKIIIDLMIDDISDLKKVETITSETKIKQKLFSKLAHEFKTPLLVIISLVNDIIKSIKSNYLSQVIKTSKKIIYISEYVSFLINDIIFYVNSTNNISINNEIIDLKEVLDFSFNVTKALKSVLCGQKSNLNVLMDFDERINHFEVKIDKIRLKQILLNIVSNAVKFTRSGYIKLKAKLKTNYFQTLNIEDHLSNESCQNSSNIVSNTSCISNTKEYSILNNNTFYSNNSSINNETFMYTIEISVLDTGIGISKEDIAKIKKFNSKDSPITLNIDSSYNQMGSGIGMSIVQNMINKLNCKFNISSELGKGTLIKLFLNDVKPKDTWSMKSDNRHTLDLNTLDVYNNSNIYGNLNILKRNKLIKNSKTKFKELKTNKLSNLKNNNNKINKESIKKNNNILNSFLLYKNKAIINTKSKSTDAIDYTNKQNYSSRYINLNNIYALSKKKQNRSTNKNDKNINYNTNNIFIINNYDKKLEVIKSTLNTNQQSNKHDNCISYLDTKENQTIDLSNKESKIIDFKYNRSNYCLSNCSSLYSSNNSLSFNTNTKPNECNVNLNNSYVSNKFILPTKSNRMQVLVVDDSKPLRKSVVNLLKKDKYFKDNFEFIEGFDGVDLLKYVIDDQFRGNKIKLVITDENMEYMCGSSAIKIIKDLENNKKLNFVYVISLTAFSDDYNKDYILKTGANLVINKPLKLSDINLIHKLLIKDKD